MNLTKEDAKQRRILEVAESLGMTMIRSSHNEYYWDIHDSFKINTAKNIFRWYSQDIGGDVIKLVQTVKDVSFKEAMLYLQTGEFSKSDSVNKHIKREPFKYVLEPYETDFKRARHYLKNERGLSDKTIDFFISKGVLSSARKKNSDGSFEEVIVFKYLDQDNHIIGASLQGIQLYTNRYPGKGYLKQIMYRSDGMAGMNVAIGEPKQLIFFEAPIDLMSYYELHANQLNNVRLVSMDGLKEQTISRYVTEQLYSEKDMDISKLTIDQRGVFLSRLAKDTWHYSYEDNSRERVVLAIDNDVAGQQFIHTLSDKEIAFLVHEPPKINLDKTDWNDVLIQYKQSGNLFQSQKMIASALYTQPELSIVDSYWEVSFCKWIDEDTDYIKGISEHIIIDTLNQLKVVYSQLTSSEYPIHLWFDHVVGKKLLEEIQIDSNENKSRLDYAFTKIFNSLTEKEQMSLAQQDNTVIENVDFEIQKNTEGTIGDFPDKQVAAPLPETTTLFPLNNLLPNQTQPQRLLHFSISDYDKAIDKRGYHIVTTKELVKLNRYASVIQQMANWYLNTVADTNIIYVYQNNNTIEQLRVQFDKDKFMHLTGIFPYKEGQTAEKTLYDFANGQGDFDSILIANKGATFDKIKVLPELEAIVDASAFYFDDLSDVHKLNKLHLDKAIKSGDKDILLAIRTIDDTAFPASLMRVNSKLNHLLQHNALQKTILGIYSEQNDVITQLSINEQYITDGGKELKEMVERTHKEILKENNQIVKEEELLNQVPKKIEENTLNNLDNNIPQQNQKQIVDDFIKARDTSGLSKHLKNGIKDYLQSDTYKTFLDALHKLHRYSPRNVQLMLKQNPNISYVASYDRWRIEFNRYVKKGEKGLKILIPNVDQKKDDNGELILDDNGNPIEELTGFKFGTVFDISQTDGKPFPQPIYLLESNVVDYENIYYAMKQVLKSEHISLSFDDTGHANGSYFPEQRKIIISNRGMSEAQIIKTLCHEMAHAFLKHELTLDKQVYDKNELQAESVAYILCQHYGIDSSDFSFAYLYQYINENNYEQFEKILDGVHKQAKQLMTKIDRALEKVKEQHIQKDTFSDKLKQAKDKQNQLTQSKENSKGQFVKKMDTQQLMT